MDNGNNRRGVPERRPEGSGNGKKKISTSAVIRIVLLVFFTVMFIFSAVMLIMQQREYKKSVQDNDEARVVGGVPDVDEFPDIDDDWFNDMYGGYFTDETDAPDETEPPAETVVTGSPDDTTPDTPAVTEPVVTEPPQANDEPKIDPYEEILKNTDLASLRKVNKDVIGWFYILGTDISYPLLHPKDNNDYIRSSWKNAATYSRAGTIFMEARNSGDFSDFNTIIYGHRMRDETMFGKLKYYNDKSYWRKHPSVYILTEEGVTRYDIYAAYEISTEGKTFTISFADDAAKQEYIDFTLESSILDTGIVPNVNDQLLTLSTCSGNGYSTRWIIQAVKARS